MSAIGTLANFRAELLNPSVDCRGVHDYAPLGQKVADVPVRKRISALPPYCHQDHILRKTVISERISAWYRQLPKASRRSSDNTTVNATEPVKRLHHETHDQLRRHLADFLNAYKYARRLKTLSGLMPYEHICKCWTSEAEGFTLDPRHQMPGPNN